MYTAGASASGREGGGPEQLWSVQKPRRRNAQLPTEAGEVLDAQDQRGQKAQLLKDMHLQ